MTARTTTHCRTVYPTRVKLSRDVAYRLTSTGDHRFGGPSRGFVAYQALEGDGVLVSQLRGRVCCCASTGSPEPRQARVELVEMYDVDAHMSSFAAHYRERGEADHDQV